MKLRFKKVHMGAVLPSVYSGSVINLTAKMIRKVDTCSIHYYGLCVEIPENYIGILLPIHTIVDRIEKVGCLAIYTPEDKNLELRAIFSVPDDLVNDYYKEGEITATLHIIPVPSLEAELVSEF